jgi:hypothetical protein
MIAFDRVWALRQGGDVLRFHNHRLIGQQSVAEHSFHAAQLLLALCPAASRNLLIAVLHHDVPEGQVGDLTYPAKRRFPELNAALEAAETEVAQELGLWVKLTPEESIWLRVVDSLECACFALSQMRLGHRGMRQVFNNCINSVNHVLGDEHWSAVRRFMVELSRAALPYWEETI